MIIRVVVLALVCQSSYCADKEDTMLQEEDTLDIDIGDSSLNETELEEVVIVEDDVIID